MRREHCFQVILVGKSILLREGLARILRAANFRILASVSCADDVCPSKSTSPPPLFLIVHTGDDFDAARRADRIVQKPASRRTDCDRSRSLIG